MPWIFWITCLPGCLPFSPVFWMPRFLELLGTLGCVLPAFSACLDYLPAFLLPGCVHIPACLPFCHLRYLLHSPAWVPACNSARWVTNFHRSFPACLDGCVLPFRYHLPGFLRFCLPGFHITCRSACGTCTFLFSFLPFCTCCLRLPFWISWACLPNFVVPTCLPARFSHHLPGWISADACLPLQILLR